MAELTGLSSSTLIQDYRNPEASKEVLWQAVKELPSAAKELAREAWQNPVDAAIHIGTTAGMGIAFGATLGYLIPGRGPVAAILGTAFTIPAVVGGYNRVNQAMLDAQHSNANIRGIAHNLARDTVSGSADFAIGMVGGLAGSELGRQIAMSNTAVGRFGQYSQRLVLKAENKTMTGLRSLMGTEAAPEPGMPQVNLRDPNAKFEKIQFDELSWAHRQQTLISNRLDQFNAADPKMNMYYGSAHGHSVYSDGMGKPAEIYAKAKEIGLDFTAVTDHSHKSARSGVPPGDPRYPGQQKTPSVAESPALYTETINAAKAATVDGEFVALYGVEFGTIGKTGSTGKSGVNHINILQNETFYESQKVPRSAVSRFFDPVRGVFNVRVPEPAVKLPPVKQIQDGNIKMLTDHLETTPDATGGRTIIQMNHPRWSADESPDLPAKVRGRDYGQKSYGSQKEWVDQFGKYASQMEILNGDALQKGASGGDMGARAHATDFAGYIDKGLKLSPTFGRDFHYGDPGGTKAATGILAQELNTKSLLDAMRARRTVATTNHENLTGYMTVNDVHPMGSVLDQAAVPDLRIKVTVGGKIAPDAEYTAVLWGDKKIGDGNLAEVIQTKKVSGKELSKSGNTIAFDEIQQTLGHKGAYFVELQRLPSGADLSSAMLPTTPAGLKKLPDFTKLSKPPVFGHSGHGGPLDPMAKFLGDRLWTAPVWSEPLAGANHNLAVRALVGMGSTLLQ